MDYIKISSFIGDDKMKMLDVQQVKETLKVSKSKAYEIIRTLNRELEDKGYLIVRGKIREDYLFERMGI